MKSFKVSNNLPFYWRLKTENEASHSFSKAPFEFELSNKGVLVQKRESEVLANLDDVYKLPANIGYFQEGYGFAQGYFSDIIDFIESSLTERDRSGVFVEIGCGGMMILDYLRREKLRVMGVDPSPLSFWASQSKEIPLVNDFFTRSVSLPDVQVFFHYDVLEHISDVNEFLSQQYEMLNENGLLIFSVPNPEPSMKLGDVSPAMHQHLNYFSRHSISRILEEVGFSEINCIEAKYGGSLNVSARKRNVQQNSNTLQSEDVLEEQFFQLVGIAQENFRSRLDALSQNLDEIGLYVPLRALPYLDLIGAATNSANLRLIDDTKTWNQKYFDGVPYPIENFFQYLDKPAPLTIVFSLTFENEISMRLQSCNLNFTTLRDLLE